MKKSEMRVIAEVTSIRPATSATLKHVIAAKIAENIKCDTDNVVAGKALKLRDSQARAAQLPEELLSRRALCSASHRDALLALLRLRYEHIYSLQRPALNVP